MVLGYLPNLFITMYASQIGSALEVGLLSLALADRINAMKEERTRILQESGRKLEALNRELADSNRLKDEFLATVTHELRTPMNGVIGSLELMQTLPLDVELEQYQKTAASSARDMMRLVNDILAMTELQAGKFTRAARPSACAACSTACAPSTPRAPRTRAWPSPWNWTKACPTPSKATPASSGRSSATCWTTPSSSPPGAASCCGSPATARSPAAPCACWWPWKTLESASPPRPMAASTAASASSTAP